jgi:hypothetical protein
VNQSFHLDGEGSTPERQAEAVRQQRDWAESVASGIERGVLPAREFEREIIAWIIRHAASQLQVVQKPKRGNPDFKAKVPHDDTVPLMVQCQIALGKTPDEAFDCVADCFGVDDSTIRKLYRKRRTAMAKLKLRHLGGAIRRE